MISRRSFMQRSVLCGTLLAIPSVASAHYSVNVSLLREPFQTIARVYDDLFPSAAGVPGADELNTVAYLRGVIRDQRVPQERKSFLFRGAEWINDEARRRYNVSYLQLSDVQRQTILHQISGFRWGDSWLYFLMEYFFESMFCDPLYGANTDQAGWRWLDYEPGEPRPRQAGI